MDELDKILAAQAPKQEEEAPAAQEETSPVEEQEEVSEESSLDTDTTSESEQEQVEETSDDSEVEEAEEEVQSSTEDDTVVSEEAESVEYSDEEFRGVLSDFFEAEVDEDKFNLIEKVLKGELSPEPEFANDTVKELNDYLNQGGSLTDFLEVKMTDFDNLEPLEVVRLKMRRDYPQLSDDQINRRLNRKYKLDEDRFDEDEVLDGKDELAIDSAEAKKYFNEIKSKYPNQVEQSKASKPQDQGVSKADQERIDAFKTSFESSIKDVKELQIGDFKFKVREDGVKNASSELSIDNSYLDEKGNFDMESYTRDKVFLQEKEQIIKSAIAHGKSLALAELKNKRNNTSLSPEKITDVKKDRTQETIDLLKSLHSSGSGGLKL